MAHEFIDEKAVLVCDAEVNACRQLILPPRAVAVTPGNALGYKARLTF